MVKQDTKLACGAVDGCILLYNWGEFGTSSDIIAKYGPKKVAINCMVPITDKIVACGYENGEIRATNTFPMRHLGKFCKTHSHRLVLCFFCITYFE